MLKDGNGQMAKNMAPNVMQRHFSDTKLYEDRKKSTKKAIKKKKFPIAIKFSA